MDQATKGKQRNQQRNGSNGSDAIVYGKVPPQANDIEQALLGGIMMQRDAFDATAEFLRADCFYNHAHQRIYTAMATLREKNQPIDLITVTEQLKTQDDLEAVGGAYYVTTLTNHVVSAAHNDHYCKIILERYMKREMIRISLEVVQAAYEDMSDVFELMDSFEKQYTSLTINRGGKAIAGLDSHLVDRIQRIYQLRKNPKHITGIPSGYSKLDKITHGWQKTDLIILAARPAVGKTAFALNLARNAAMNEHHPVPVAFFSLEMSTGQLVDRILAAESEIWLEKISNGWLEDDHMVLLVEKGVKPLGQFANISIDDTPALTIYELRARCRRLKRRWLKEYGTDDGLIIIDYLQLMSGEGERRSGNREQEISTISRGLKALAKELSVPIIALSQLSRQTEQRKGEEKTPRLSDLRESGAIEQDADMVMFMYRPEYYEVKTDELGETTKGLTHVSIAKHRNGKLAQGNEAIKLRANLAIQKFTEWTDDVITTYVPGLPSGKWRPVETERPDELPFR
ncbi:MAG: replicative DNA helicase [Chitinophagaceae bacterium]|nr:replicative DNA helicase [Chitinophagaceae bacterium]